MLICGEAMVNKGRLRGIRQAISSYIRALAVEE